MSKSFGPYFQDAYNTKENGTPGYIRTHYDTTGACSGSLSRSLMGRNVIGRIFNNFVELIHTHILLPKAVLIVMENDILDAINHYKYGDLSAIEPCVKWSVTEFHRATVSYKEKLPSKSRKFRYPYILFVAAIHHDGFGNGNAYREKFNKALVHVVDIYHEISVLFLPAWNNSDMSCISHSSLNGKGFDRYWEAINDAFQAWDKSLMKTYQSKNTVFSRQHGFNKKPHFNRYHWQRKDNKKY